MDNLQLFNFEGNEVRTLKINDEPYFVGKDVANILGYSNTRKALQDHRGKLRIKIYTVWTQKGRRFIYDILKKNGILPLIERED